MSEFEKGLEVDLVRGLPGKSGGIVDAAWLDPAELTGPDWRYRGPDNTVSGVLLGYRNGRGVGTLDNRHMLTVVGSRGGKGVSLIIPNLLMYDGSVIAIDPKGELAAITAHARRKKGQKVVILDPFHVSGVEGLGRFNPLDELDPDSENLKDDVALIADALIIGSERDTHFTDTARIMVEALILFTLQLPISDRTLTTVYRLLAGSHPLIIDIGIRTKGEITGRAALFKLMQACTEPFDGTVAGHGNNFTQMADRELAGVFSTALTQLKFLDSGAMSAVLTSGNLKLSELKTGRATLYLCLPAMRMATHARWLRVIINLALVALERTKARLDVPVLTVLDEFPVLGHMQSIEKAAGLMAGFGVKLWIIIQDLSQIKALYSKSWETFVGNAGVLMFWSNADATTLAFVSDKLGQTGVRLEQSNDTTMQQRLSGASGRREELRVQKLAAPHELEKILDRRKRRALIIATGQSPVILQRILYYEDAAFAGMFGVWTGTP